MFALNHSSIFHLHRRKCARPSLLPLPPPRSIVLHICSSLLILLILSANKNNGKSIVLCDAAAAAVPSPLHVLPPTQTTWRTSSGRSVGTAIGSDRYINNNVYNGHHQQQQQQYNNNVVAVTAAALRSTSASSQVGNVTRQYGGDVFDAMGKHQPLERVGVNFVN